MIRYPDVKLFRSQT